MAPKKPKETDSPGAHAPLKGLRPGALPGQNRRFLRVSTSLRVEYRAKGQPVSSYTSDISAGGMFLRREKNLAVDEHVDFKVVLGDGGHIVLAGTVHRVDSAGAGVEFDGSQETQKRLRKHLEQQHIRKLEEDLERSPHVAEKIASLAAYYYETDRPEKALELYRRGWRGNSRNVSLCDGLSRALLIPLNDAPDDHSPLFAELLLVVHQGEALGMGTELEEIRQRVDEIRVIAARRREEEIEKAHEQRLARMRERLTAEAEAATDEKASRKIDDLRTEHGAQLEQAQKSDAEARRALKKSLTEIEELRVSLVAAKTQVDKLEQNVARQQSKLAEEREDARGVATDLEARLSAAQAAETDARKAAKSHHLDAEQQRASLAAERAQAERVKQKLDRQITRTAEELQTAEALKAQQEAAFSQLKEREAAARREAAQAKIEADKLRVSLTETSLAHEKAELRLEKQTAKLAEQRKELETKVEAAEQSDAETRRAIKKIQGELAEQQRATEKNQNALQQAGEELTEKMREADTLQQEIDRLTLLAQTERKSSEQLAARRDKDIASLKEGLDQAQNATLAGEAREQELNQRVSKLEKDAARREKELESVKAAGAVEREGNVKALRSSQETAAQQLRDLEDARRDAKTFAATGEELRQRVHSLEEKAAVTAQARDTDARQMSAEKKSLSARLRERETDLENLRLKAAAERDAAATLLQSREQTVAQQLHELEEARSVAKALAASGDARSHRIRALEEERLSLAQNHEVEVQRASAEKGALSLHLAEQQRELEPLKAEITAERATAATALENSKATADQRLRALEGREALVIEKHAAELKRLEEQGAGKDGQVEQLRLQLAQIQRLLESEREGSASLAAQLRGLEGARSSAISLKANEVEFQRRIRELETERAALEFSRRRELDLAHEEKQKLESQLSDLRLLFTSELESEIPVAMGRELPENDLPYEVTPSVSTRDTGPGPIVEVDTDPDAPTIVGTFAELDLALQRSTPPSHMTGSTEGSQSKRGPRAAKTGRNDGRK